MSLSNGHKAQKKIDSQVITFLNAMTLGGLVSCGSQHSFKLTSTQNHILLGILFINVNFSNPSCVSFLRLFAHWIESCSAHTPAQDFKDATGLGSLLI